MPGFSLNILDFVLWRKGCCILSLAVIWIHYSIEYDYNSLNLFISSLFLLHVACLQRMVRYVEMAKSGSEAGC